MNRVPHYQRLFQDGEKKHVRQWLQVRLAQSLFRQPIESIPRPDTHANNGNDTDAEKQSDALPVLFHSLWRVRRYVKSEIKSSIGVE